MVKARREKGGSTKITKGGGTQASDRGANFEKVSGSTRRNEGKWSEGTSGTFSQRFIDKT